MAEMAMPDTIIENPILNSPFSQERKGDSHQIRRRSRRRRAEECQILFLVSHSARKNQKQSLTPRRTPRSAERKNQKPSLTPRSAEDTAKSDTAERRRHREAHRHRGAQKRRRWWRSPDAQSWRWSQNGHVRHAAGAVSW